MSAPLSAESSVVSRLARRWNDFFFAERAVYPAVYFRIVLASWTILFFLPRLPHFAELYTTAGVHVPHPWLVRVGAVIELPMVGVELLFALLLALLIAFGIGATHARRAHLPIMAILAYFFSYDISTVRGYGQLAFYQWLVLFCLPYDRLKDTEGNVFCAPRWGLRLATMLFSSVYLFSVCAKTIGGEGWFDGRTLYYTFRGQDYGQFLLSAWFPISLDVARVLGWATLASECFVGLGLWHPRTKRLAMFVCVGMHTMMALTMRVSILFHLLMVAHLPLFFSTETWERLATRFGRSKGGGGSPSSISDLRRTPM
ncbi:MAG: HTTM domain-containing protein [Polyangiaceae bacterium]